MSRDADRTVPRPVRDVSSDLATPERRKYTRFACPTDASVRLQSGTPARVLDLGLGGALVESSTRLAPGSMTAVVFNSADAAFRVRTRVRHVVVSGFTGAVGGGPLLYRAGLEFEALSPADASAVEAFVSNVARVTAEESARPEAADLDQAPSTPNSPLAVEAPLDRPSPAPVGAPGVPRAPIAVQTDRAVLIRFPAGWATTTRKRAVVARAPEDRGYVFLGAPQAPRGGLCEFARASMHGAGFSELHSEPAKINGLEACIGFYTGWSDEVGAVMVEAAYVVLDNQTYVIAGVAPWATYETVRHEFFATINSFGEGTALLPGSPAAAPPQKTNDDSTWMLSLAREREPRQVPAPVPSAGTR